MRFGGYVFTLVLVQVAMATPASAGIVNGDFETGDLSGWTTSAIGGSPLISVVMPGTNHFAELATGDFATGPFISTLEQTFTVDPATPQLSFDFTLPSTILDPTGTGLSPFLDSFVVSLLSGASFFDLLLVDQFGAIADPFGTAPGTTGVAAPSDVAFDFSLVADLSSLVGESVTLFFDVINEDDGFESVFALDNVQLTGTGAVVPEPSTFIIFVVGLLTFCSGLRLRRASADVPRRNRVG